MNEKQQITNEARPDTVAIDTEPDIRQNCTEKRANREENRGRKGVKEDVVDRNRNRMMGMETGT